MLSGTYYLTSPLVLQQVAFMSETIDNFSMKSDMFMKVTTAVKLKLKLQKYLMEIPSVFTCSAALNPCYNTLGVDTLIDQINDNLCLYEINQQWGPLMKPNLKTILKVFSNIIMKNMEIPHNMAFFNLPNFRRGVVLLLLPMTPTLTCTTECDKKV